MKNKLFLFLALIGMMLPQIVSAERFEVNGIYYSTSGNNAAVVQAIQAGISTILEMSLSQVQLTITVTPTM